MSAADSDDLIDLTSEADVSEYANPCLDEAHDLQRLKDALPGAESRDAALEIALSAAELSMRALKLAKDPVLKNDIDAKVRYLLQEAERIKFGKDWRTNRKPAVSPSSSKPVNVKTIRKLREPASTREASKAEQILVMKASFLNGFKFPPWRQPPDDSDFQLAEGGGPFLYVNSPG